MAVVSAGELRNRVEVLRRIGRANPLGEQTYDYEAEDEEYMIAADTMDILGK